MNNPNIIQSRDYYRLQSVLHETNMSKGKLQVPKSISKEDLAIIYRLFRKSILDGYIPLKKPIGFNIINANNFEESDVTSRNTALLESQISIIENLSKIIITDDSVPPYIKTKPLFGKVTAGDLCRLDCTPIRCLDPALPLFTAREEVSLILVPKDCTRYRLMEENMKDLEEFKESIDAEDLVLYPLNVHSSLIDYIHILPFNHYDIRYTLVGSISEKDMNKVWHKFLNSIEERKEVIN